MCTSAGRSYQSLPLTLTPVLTVTIISRSCLIFSDLLVIGITWKATLSSSRTLNGMVHTTSVSSILFRDGQCYPHTLRFLFRTKEAARPGMMYFMYVVLAPYYCSRPYQSLCQRSLHSKRHPPHVLPNLRELQVAVPAINEPQPLAQCSLARPQVSTELYGTSSVFVLIEP